MATENKEKIKGSPLCSKIYGSPKNCFAANFIGNINFLNANVVTVQLDQPQLAITG